MTKLMIIPAEEYKILNKYLFSDVILIPEPALNALPPEAQAKAQELAKCGDIPYNFGGNADISVDIIFGKFSRAYEELLRDKSEGADS